MTIGIEIRPVVLFGTWGPPSLTFARSCGAAGVPVYFVSTDLRGRSWSGLTRHLAGGFGIEPSIVGTRDGIELLRAFTRYMGAGGLIAVSDSHLQWLAQNRDMFEPDCKVLAPIANCITLLQSKRKQIGIAEKAGFQILSTWYISGPEDVERIPPSAFPLVLRPDNQDTAAQPTFKVRLAQTPLEVLQLIENVVLMAPIIAQPFKALPNLLVHGVRSENGEIIGLHAFEVYRKFEGLALSMRSTELPLDLDQACRAFVQLAGVVGCFHFDLLYSPPAGDSYFLEINPRLGGTTARVTRLGFDEPRFTLQAFGLLPMGSTKSIRVSKARITNRKVLVKHMAYALTGRCTALDFPDVGRISGFVSSLIEFLSVRDAIWSIRDLRGMLSIYRHNIRLGLPQDAIDIGQSAPKQPGMVHQ